MSKSNSSNPHLTAETSGLRLRVKPAATNKRFCLVARPDYILPQQHNPFALGTIPRARLLLQQKKKMKKINTLYGMYWHFKDPPIHFKGCCIANHVRCNWINCLICNSLLPTPSQGLVGGLMEFLVQGLSFASACGNIFILLFEQIVILNCSSLHLVLGFARNFALARISGTSIRRIPEILDV